MQYVDLKQIDEQLAKIGSIRSRIQEYRLTMGYLHVELSATDYSKRGDLYFNNCLFICGPTQGGPWVFRASEIEEDGQKVIKVSAGGDSFYVKALRVALSAPDQVADTE
jgi:hypothetical protein